MKISTSLTSWISRCIRWIWLSISVSHALIVSYFDWISCGRFQASSRRSAVLTSEGEISLTWLLNLSKPADQLLHRRTLLLLRFLNPSRLPGVVALMYRAKWRSVRGCLFWSSLEMFRLTRDNDEVNCFKLFLVNAPGKSVWSPSWGSAVP